MEIKQPEPKQPITKLFIEKLPNGYIVHENKPQAEDFRNMSPEYAGSITPRKVYETTEALINYLKENFSL